MKPLSPAQVRYLRARPLSASLLRYFRAVQHFVAEQGYGPTLRQLGAYLGTPDKPYSTNAVQEALMKLQAHGLVTWAPGSMRTLRIIGSVPGDPPAPAPYIRMVQVVEPVRCARCGCEHYLGPVDHQRVCARYQTRDDS